MTRNAGDDANYLIRHANCERRPWLLKLPTRGHLPVDGSGNLAPVNIR